MELSQFDYYLPKELIAQKPKKPRDHSRLMILDRENKKIEDKKFYQIEKYLKKGDVLVMNNSKVFPARLSGLKETGGKVEIFLLKEIDAGSWEVLLKNFSLSNFYGAGGRKIIIINKKLKKTKLEAEILKNLDEGKWFIKFSFSGKKLKQAIYKFGQTPTPPYIKRESNLKDYQTIYAKHIGSVAAPTAGFHFTKDLIKKLKNKGVKFEFLTLHVGLGTFASIKSDNIEEHKIHLEYASLNKETAKRLNKAKKEGKRIIAVGTTTTRVLETAVNGSQVKSFEGWIKTYIYPGYKFKFIDALITNFHLPKSTLLFLVSAFADRDFILRAYQKAIKDKYRFYSFGDAMFIS